MSYALRLTVDDNDGIRLGHVDLAVHKHIGEEYIGMAQVFEENMFVPGLHDETNPLPWMIAVLRNITARLEEQMVAETEVASEKLVLNFKKHKTR